MGRASLRKLGITDNRIDSMTSRQAAAALMANEVMHERLEEARRERAFFEKAVRDGAHIPVRTE